MDFSQSPPPPGLTGAWAKGKLQTAVQIREQKEREEAEAVAAAAEAAKTKRGLRSALSEAFTVSTTIAPSKNIAKNSETNNNNNSHVPSASSPSTTTSSTPSASIKGNNHNFKNTNNNNALLFPSLLDSTTTTTTTTTTSTIRPQVQQQLKDLEKRSNARMTLREREALKAHLKSMLRASDEHQMEVAARQEERRKKTQDRWNRGEVNPFQPSLIQLSDFANSNSNNNQNNNNNNGKGNAAVAAPPQQKKISVLSKDGTKASHIIVARKNQVEKGEESNIIVNKNNNDKLKNEKANSALGAKTSPIPISNIPAPPPAQQQHQQQQNKVVKLSSLTIVKNHKAGEDPMTVTKRLIEQQQQAELERKQKIANNNNMNNNNNNSGVTTATSSNVATGVSSDKNNIIITNSSVGITTTTTTMTGTTTSTGATTMSTANSKPKSTVILGGGAALQQPLSDQKKKKKYSSQKHPTAMKRAVRRARRDLFAFYANDVEMWYNSLLVNSNNIENENNKTQGNVRTEITLDEGNTKNKNQKKKESKKQKTSDKKKDDVDLFDMGDGFGEDVKAEKKENPKPDGKNDDAKNKNNNKNDVDVKNEDHEVDDDDDDDDYFENESSSSSSSGNDDDLEEFGDDDDDKDDFAQIVMDVTLELAEEEKESNNQLVSPPHQQQLPEGISPELIKKLHDQIVRTQKMVQNLQRQHDLVHNAFVSRDMDSIKKEVSRLKWKMRKMGKLQVPSQGGILSLHQHDQHHQNQNKIDEKQQQEKTRPENSSIKNNNNNENKNKKAKAAIANTCQQKIAAKQQQQAGRADNDDEHADNDEEDRGGKAAITATGPEHDDDSKEQQAITQTMVSEKLAHLFYPRLWSYEGVGLHPNAAKVDQRIDLRKFGVSGSTNNNNNNNNFQWPAGRLVRDYVTNILSRDLDGAATKFLARLQAANSKLRTQQPLHYKARMRYVMGFREVLKGISTERVKFVILAPDVEPAPGTGGLDEHLMKILSACGIHYDATKENAQAFAANIPNLHDIEKEKKQQQQQEKLQQQQQQIQQRKKNPFPLKQEQATEEKESSTTNNKNITTTGNALQYSSSHRAYQPRCIFAMSRLQLARVFHQKNRLVSIVGVFSADSAYDELKHMLAVASNNVELYKRMMDGEDITTMTSKTLNESDQNDDADEQ